MYNIQYLNSISPKGTELWSEDYKITEAAEEAQG